jgi:RNA polymerase sigma-70 factor (ECF subfamily)
VQETSVGDVPGFADAVAKVYEAEGARLFRAVLAFTGREDVAEDAVAEAFAQALRGDGRIRDPSGWVWRTAFVLARAEMQRSGRVGCEVPERASTDPDVSRLLDALALLPFGQRAVIVLHHIAGYPTSEVADMVGMSAGAVRVALHRGRRRLERALADGEGW